MENRNETLKKLVLSAVMIAIGTVLSLDIFKFGGLWAFGGGVTFCSMLPLVMVSYIYGCRWGAFTAFAYSLIQLLQGIDNVQYATSVPMAIAIILLDYRRGCCRNLGDVLRTLRVPLHHRLDDLGRSLAEQHGTAFAHLFDLLQRFLHASGSNNHFRRGGDSHENGAEAFHRRSKIICD